MTTSSSDSVSSSGVSEPAPNASGRTVLPAGDEPAMRDWAAELVERARSAGVELTGDNGLLTALVRQVLQTGLEVEMTDHLGYEPHATEGRGSGYSRNGRYPEDRRLPGVADRRNRPIYGAMGINVEANATCWA